MIRFLSLETANPDVCAGAGNFLQSRFWGDFKARTGWTPFYFSALWEYSGRGTASGSEGGNAEPAPGMPAAPLTKTAPLLALYRRLGPFFGFAYIPWGPSLGLTSLSNPKTEFARQTPYLALPIIHDGMPASNEGGADWFPGVGDRSRALTALAARLKQFLPKNTVFIRFDLPWQSGDPALVEARSAPLWLGPSFSRASADVQPPDTVIIDLAADEGEMLARMKNKWRYNIGLAEKKGVVVRRAGIEGFPSFYKLYLETARRDGIGIHGIGYYETLFEEAAKTLEAGGEGVDIRLYLASHEDEDIAGIITLFRKDEAVYLYGASANHKRNLMAPYALQWRAMRDAKAGGCRFYDLYGIPPRPPEEDPGHPMAGLYRFKTGFGGRVVFRPGCHDYACRPILKSLYSAAEALRKKLRDAHKRRRPEGRASKPPAHEE